MFRRLEPLDLDYYEKGGAAGVSFVRALVPFIASILVIIALLCAYRCDLSNQFADAALDEEQQAFPTAPDPVFLTPIVDGDYGPSTDNKKDASIGELLQFSTIPQSKHSTERIVRLNNEDGSTATKPQKHGKFCVYHEGSCAKRAQGHPGRLFTCNERVEDNVCINFPDDAILYTCAKNSLVSHYAVAGCASSAFIKEEEIACVDMVEDTYFLLCCTADNDLTPCDPVVSPWERLA